MRCLPASMSKNELVKTKDKCLAVINQDASALSQKACLAALLEIINQKSHNNFKHFLQ